MAALSKIFTVRAFYARVANRCRHVDNFILDEQSILDIAKMEILANYSAATSSLRKYYHTYETLNVTGNNRISLAGKNYFDITNVSYGMTQLYHASPSITKFINTQNELHGETLDEGRYWFWEQGRDEILIFQGVKVIAAGVETSLNVHHIRYPDLSNMTLDASRAGLAYMDLPDWSVPYFYLATAVSAIKEQNLSVPASLANEATAVLSSLSDKLTAEEMELQKQHIDNMTR